MNEQILELWEQWAISKCMIKWRQRVVAVHTWTNSGLPNRKALSRFFLKASSRKLVLVIFRSLYSFMMNSVAWPDGSMISGYLERAIIENRTTFEVKSAWGLINAQECFPTKTKHYNDRRERYWPVEPLKHDGILSAEVISWEGVGLPAEPLVSVGQVLSSGNIGTELLGEDTW